jgi:hypothetical protein
MLMLRGSYPKSPCRIRMETGPTCRSPLPLLSYRPDLALCEIEVCCQSFYSRIKCLGRQASCHHLEVSYLRVL